MPGQSGEPSVTTLVCFFHSAREAAGAAGARHSLRPLSFGGCVLRKARAYQRRGDADAQPWLFEIWIGLRRPGQAKRDPGPI